MANLLNRSFFHMIFLLDNNMKNTEFMEKVRKIFLIPSLSQWGKWSLPAKQTTAGLVLGIISIAFTIYTFLPSTPQEPPRKAYDLSQSSRTELLEILKTAKTDQRDTLRIGCVTWSEVSCLTAGKFLTVFSEAGWKIDSDRVYKMEPSIPVEGVSIATRGDDLVGLKKLPPHMGRWTAMDESHTIILMA